MGNCCLLQIIGGALNHKPNKKNKAKMYVIMLAQEESTQKMAIVFILINFRINESICCGALNFKHLDVTDFFKGTLNIFEPSFCSTILPFSQ